MKNLQATIKHYWLALPDWIRRVIHTFYQSFIGVFLVGVVPVLTGLLKTGNLSAGKVALGSLVAAAIAAAISAAKAAIVSNLTSSK